MKKLLTPRFFTVSGIIVIAAILRITMSFIPNVSPIAAMALFGGAYLTRKYLAVIIPLVVLFLSDLVLGLHSSMIYVYAAFAITSFIGIAIRNNLKVSTIIGGSLLSSIIFFLITNFGSWMTGMMPYPMNIAGLTECYVAGLPFFRNELIGTLAFNSVFFGAFYFAQKRIPALIK